MTGCCPALGLEPASELGDHRVGIWEVRGSFEADHDVRRPRREPRLKHIRETGPAGLCDARARSIIFGAKSIPIPIACPSPSRSRNGPMATPVPHSTSTAMTPSIGSRR